MARTLNKLTARAVATITKPGRHSDGGGLYLAVSKAGTRGWVFFWSRGGKQREMGLGSAGPGGSTLAQAREKAANARKLLADGLDPIAARNAAKAVDKANSITFGSFADEYVADHRAGWTNEKHAAQWAMTLGPAYCRTIRKKQLSEINVEDVLGVLKPVWQTKPETARRIRMRLERILDAARVRGLREGENPARWRGYLDNILPKHTKASRGHHRALDWQDVPDFTAQLRTRNGIAARALEFTILTAARSGEVRGMRWHEIDLEAATWTIGAERMKAKRAHRVPLAERAVDLIEQMAEFRPKANLDEALVFPGAKFRKPMSDMTLAAVLKRMEINATVHGFRSSFRDWAAEATNHPGEVAEMALAHAVANATEAAYRRGDLFEKRRRLMDEWAGFLNERSEGADNIVPIKREDIA